MSVRRKMHTPRPTHRQFSLRSILILTAVFAAVFGVLSALGISPLHAALGFGVLGGMIGAQVLAIELVYRALQQR
jgi:hypothetical protein